MFTPTVNTPLSELRRQIRRGEYCGHTSGLAPGFVQANVVILPEAYTADFLDFCRANPQPCPLIAMTPGPGAVSFPGVVEDCDLRLDLPRYCLFHKGQMTREVTEIRLEWREDLRGFLLGCSFSFEEALLAAGLEIRNVTEKKNVPMFITNRPCRSAGPFAAPLVVSMRPMRPADARRAADICAEFPAVHGAPVRIGDAEALGIRDLDRPDFGEAVSIRAGEVPVFWACGVTPLLAIRHAAPDFSVTHSPGHMLITDLKNAEMTGFSFQVPEENGFGS